ncbi:MAG: hypothetical protein K9J12_02635 [Melioribacteraceae bacterium]|nr:hypothetical protein [Melioribacteraceae bacterium]MCF8266322.1 hypothetical protein [Melioribacteraceae bacterium]MCF8414136.1 hypothetical protein [Melioribacteraceae bacterium]
MNLNKIIPLFFITVFGIYFFACSSTKEESKSNEMEVETTAEHPPPPPPPGSAQADVEVVSVEENGNRFLLTLNVINAGKFGNTVPPIPKGVELKAWMPIKEEKPKIGDKFRGLLDYKAEVVGENTPNWRIKKINN